MCPDAGIGEAGCAISTNRLIKKMAKSKTAKRSEQGEKFKKKGPIPKESIAGRLPPITPAVALPSPSVLEGLVPDIARVRSPIFNDENLAMSGIP